MDDNKHEIDVDEINEWTFVNEKQEEMDGSGVSSYVEDVADDPDDVEQLPTPDLPEEFNDPPM